MKFGKKFTEDTHFFETSDHTSARSENPGPNSLSGYCKSETSKVADLLAPLDKLDGYKLSRPLVAHQLGYTEVAATNILYLREP